MRARSKALRCCGTAAGAACVGLGILALIPGLPAAAASATSWQVAATIKAVDAGTLQVDPVNDTVYAADFEPQTPTSPESSHILVINGLTNTITAQIPAQLAPANGSMALDEAARKVYVPNYGSESISVIDGVTNTATEIDRPDSMPWGAAYDPVTNSVYVTDGDDNGQLPQGQVYVVDAATDTISEAIPVDDSAASPAVDPAENKLFVPIERTDEVDVIDTQTNTVTAGIDVATGSSPRSVVVDEALHKGYVLGSDGITVFSTVTDQVIGNPVALSSPAIVPTSIAINPATHHVFVSGETGTSESTDAGYVYEIDGSSPTTPGAVVGRTQIPGLGAIAVAINPVTNTMYVSSQQPNPDSFLGATANIVVLRDLPVPTPSPTPTPAPVPAQPAAVSPARAAGSRTLASTGVNLHAPLTLSFGGGLLTLGIFALAISRRRNSSRAR